MSKTVHTPGPWVVSDQGVGFEVDSNDGWQVAQAQQRPEDGRGKPSSVRLANARLIAAAPDLLEALKKMLDVWEHGGIATYPIGEARAAIKKAEGQS